MRSLDSSVRVERVGRDAEPQCRGVALVVERQVAQDLRPSPTPSTSTPVAIGIERACMPDRRVPSALRANATTSCDDEPARLVAQQDAVTGARP